MAFSTVPPAPASPEDTVVAVDDWYPPIDCNAMRDALRLGTMVTHTRLVAAIEGGLLSVTADLAAWRAEKQAAGAAGLDQVAPDEQLGGENRLVLLFTRAVRFAAAAELAELHRDLSATNDGASRADAQLLSAAEYQRLRIGAVRDILGVSRVAVELI